MKECVVHGKKFRFSVQGEATQRVLSKRRIFIIKRSLCSVKKYKSRSRETS